MRKILLLIVAPFAFLSALSAQITQKEADGIVLERLKQETQFYTVYAKANLQKEGFTITTAAGEEFELDYACWVYYFRYNDDTQGRYLIVNESNGNLLEVNAKNDAGPDGLDKWRVALDMTTIDFNNIENLYAQPLPVIQKCVQGRWKLDSLLGGMSGIDDVNSREILVEINGNKWYDEEFQWKKHTAYWSAESSFKTYVIQRLDEPSPWVFFLFIENGLLCVGYPWIYVFPTRCYDCYIGELWVRTE